MRERERRVRTLHAKERENRETSRRQQPFPMALSTIQTTFGLPETHAGKGIQRNLVPGLWFVRRKPSILSGVHLSQSESWNQISSFAQSVYHLSLKWNFVLMCSLYIFLPPCVLEFRTLSLSISGRQFPVKVDANVRLDKVSVISKDRLQNEFLDCNTH